MTKLITTYTGHGTAGNMADPANWSGQGGINSGSVTLIPIDATLNATTTVAQMMLLGQEHVTINGTLNTLNTGFCSSFMVCNAAVATFAGTATLDAAGGIIVGSEETGALVAQGQAGARANLNSVAARIGQHAGSHGSVTLDGGVWHDQTGVVVGESGNGTLNVIDGGQLVEAGHLTFAANATSTGQGQVASGGVISVAGNVRIGNDHPAGATGIAGFTVGAGGTVHAGGSFRVCQSSTLAMAGGTIALTSQPFVVSAGGSAAGYGSIAASAIAIAGTMHAAGGTLALTGPLSGQGTLQIDAGATAQINAATIAVAHIAFAGAGATLALAHGATNHATITGFTTGDTISMAGQIDHLDWNATTDILTLSTAGHAADTLHLTGTYATGFDLSQTSAGAMITVHVPTH